MAGRDPLGRIARGAAAGAVAAIAWAAQQPLDKRIIGTRYDDVELLGKLVTRGPGWRTAGLAMHAANGAMFGATYAFLRPRLPGKPVALALTAAMAENFGFWPLGRLIDRHHPARRELEPLQGNRRALAAATWRHALFGVVMGTLEQRLNDQAVPFTPTSAGNRPGGPHT